jgi:predicted transcriptional regulator
MPPSPNRAKDAAQAVVSSLPDDASWDDVQYHLYVRQQIEAGLADDDAGRLIDTNELRQRLDNHVRLVRHA